MKFNLLYGPEDNVNTGSGEADAFYVTGQLVCTPTDFDINFIFSKPAPSDIDIRIRVHVYNAAVALDCTSAWETFTFSTGELSEYVTMLLCNDLEEEWTVIIEVEYDDAEITSMDLLADDTYSQEPDAFIYTVI